MNILTAEEITNLYLYGTPTTPTNLADESLIRPNNTPPLEISVDGNAFMQTGPGRFALPVLWDVVNEFFNLNRGVETGTYTEQQLRALFGIGIEDATKDLYQFNYDDGLDNYAERTYIWNSGSYEIDDSAVFVVDANGNRHIEHFAVKPIGILNGPRGTNGGILDNFDFEGGGLATILNGALEPKIDPSGIGIQVNIEITNVSNFRTYTIADYVADTQKYNSSYVNTASAFLRLATEGYDLINQIFNSGVTKFLDAEGKPILYGTDTASDDLDGTISVTGVDISAANHPLAQWVKNGITYFGGAGNDYIAGTQFADKLFGGNDNDILSGRGGNDILEGGEGNDTYIYTSGDGFDAIPDRLAA